MINAYFNMDYDELGRYEINNNEIVGSVIINNPRLYELINNLNYYCNPILIYTLISMLTRSFIYTNSRYPFEYLSKKCSLHKLNKGFSPIHFNVEHYETVVENHKSILRELEIPNIIIDEIMHELHNIFLKYIKTNNMFNNSVSFFNSSRSIFIFVSVGTIQNFRYRELMGESIVNIKNCRYDDGGIWTI